MSQIVIKTITEFQMFEKFRYSSSFFIAIIFTFFSFIGMSLLGNTPKYNRTTQIEMTGFSKIQDMDKPSVKKIIKKPPPKKEVTNKPPATPSLKVKSIQPRGGVDVPFNNELTKIPADITTIALPNIDTDFSTGTGNNNTDLIPIVIIEPRYPPKAAIAKIEGWVTVEFTVNELGMVTNAKVINAKPIRIFDTAAIHAINKSKFRPLMIDGQAVAQRATQTFEFKLDKQ
jgi:protein TonB